MDKAGPYLIGVISDTHGLLRTRALQVLESCDLILHAGDVGGPEILEELGSLAPLTAVRGNCDVGAWAERLPISTVVAAAGLSLYMTHIPQAPSRVPLGNQVVVFGHTHTPDQEHRDGVLYLNPGSAGPRRGSLPVSLALLRLEGGSIQVEFVDLQAPA
jgi:putative phosphoesterase